MSWRIEYGRTFFKELAKLPANPRKQIEDVVFGGLIKEDPFLQGKAKKIVGYEGYYRLRFGQYRVGLHIDAEHNTVEFLRVLHRKDIYRKFP
jgi:mRNA interferase RelE/StbE